MYYGIGLSIGILFVAIFFGGRGCSWLPEHRVKASIFSQIIVIDTSSITKGVQLSDSLYKTAIQSGKINFGLSARKGEPKSYFFSFEDSKKKSLYFHVLLETDGVMSIVKHAHELQRADTKNPNFWLPIIHVPGDSNYVSIHEDAANDFNLYQLTRNDIHESLKKNGSAETVHIDLDSDKRKIHELKFSHNGNNFKITVRYFQNSIQIMSISAL